MSENVEPEEAEAIRELVQEEGEREDVSMAVEQRDFRRPRRISGGTLEGFRHRLSMLLPELDKALRLVFKAPLRTEVAELSETSAEGLFDDLQKPFALAGFDVAGQPAWITWDIRAAVRAIELLLGSGGDPEPRELSSIENRLLSQILSTVVDVVCRSLSVEAADLRVETSLEDIAGWRDPGEGAEPHRLCVAVSFEGLGESSVFHLYLPGFDEGRDLDAEAAAALLPAHAGRVTVEVGAYLGSSDVPLDNLLALEVGDVIPLGTSLSDPVLLRVEGLACGTAEMGMHNGNRAVRILEVNPILDDPA